MSWSFNAIGRPDAIAAKLEQESARLTGQCKLEFDAALPHLAALLRENFATEQSGYNSPLVKFSASGSGYARTNAGDPSQPVIQLQRSCNVSIEQLYAGYVLLEAPPAPAPAPSEPVNQEPATPPPAAPQSESDSPAPSTPAEPGPSDPAADAAAPVINVPSVAVATPTAEIPGAWRGKY